MKSHPSEECRDCGAPRVRRAGTSSIQHVRGCCPDAAWEARGRVGGVWGDWTPIPSRDAHIYRCRSNTQVRLVEVSP